MPILTTPVKPKSKQGGAARVIDEIEVPMLDGNFYEVKLVAGTGANKKGPKPIPTMRVSYVQGGHQADINVSDFDARLHRKVEPPRPQAPEASPTSPTAAPEAPEAPEAPAPPLEFSELNADAFVDLVMEVKDPASLDAMEEYERDNKGRKTVLRAIADRREEL
jgi:hypothetical protein